MRALAVRVSPGPCACLTAGGALLVARVVYGTSNRGFTYMPDMAQSVPYDSFAPNPVTRDGKTLQRAGAGDHSARVPAVAVSAPRRRKPSVPDASCAIPFPAAPKQWRSGRLLSQTYCLVCHGEQGQGDGPLVPRIPNPPSYTSERVRAIAPGHILHVITYGSGRMPSYAAQVSLEQRWLIVHYVGALQRGGGERP